MDMSIGRNDPCPCGSGKKYKRCCIDKDVVPSHEPARPHPIIMVREVGDYGEPKVDADFFKNNPLRGFSAQRLIYSCLLRPEVEELADDMARQHFFRGEDERRRIEQTSDAEGLIAILRQRPDSLNQRLLREKLLQLREIVVPMLVDGLSRPHDDCFVEQAVRVIYASRINCSPALIKLITSSGMEAYAVSLICMICGMTGSAEEALKPIWDRFHFFNKNYPEENFSQGPWLGLFELTHGHLDMDCSPDKLVPEKQNKRYRE